MLDICARVVVSRQAYPLAGQTWLYRQKEGIHISVDGQEVKTLNLGGMLGVLISKGTHTVKLSYKTPGLWEGAVCSGLFAGLLAASSGLVFMMRRRRQSK